MSSDVFLPICKAEGLPIPETEYAFWPGRKFAFDYAWPDYKVALESEGGVWSGGRHTSGSGFMRDMEKYNEAAVRGWVVLRTVPRKLCSRETFDLLHRALAISKARNVA